MKSEKSSLALAALILIFFLSSALCCADDKIILPETIGDWKISDDIQVYEGDDLYLYINGGAELYHEYGFLNVTATDYLLGEDSIAVEVYRLKNSAFGLYSLLRDESGKELSVGQEGCFSDYYLLFWQGNDLVAITAHSDKGNNPRLLGKIAASLSPVLSKNGAIPSYISILPQEGLINSSIKYMVGSIGLLNSYPELAKYFFGFKEAAAGKYSDGKTILVIRWGSAAEAKAAMAKATTLTAKEENNNDNIAVNGEEYSLTLGKTIVKAKIKNASIVFSK